MAKEKETVSGVVFRRAWYYEGKHYPASPYPQKVPLALIEADPRVLPSTAKVQDMELRVEEPQKEQALSSLAPEKILPVEKKG